MVKLRDLLALLPSGLEADSQWRSSGHPSLDLEVKGLSTNSWACQPGDLFVGMPGTRVDGGNFWSNAIDAGAIAALVSTQVERPASGEALLIPMTDMSAACAALASTFYDSPSRKLRTVGVTGTNGKTTTSHLIEYLFNQTQRPAALLGTLYARWPGYEKTATHTTPFAVDLQHTLAQAVAAGCHYGVMEVSSHALNQKRVLGCEFDVAIFTNLTQDHLDYHKDMEDYFAAKALLFTPAYLRGKAVINIDDVYGVRLAESLSPENVWTYSTQSETADLWTSDLSYGSSGVEGQLCTPAGSTAFRLPLVGQFNVANFLAAVGAGLALDLELDTIVQTLSAFSGVPGRMQQITVKPDQDISVVVDYAHTPDSLENLLRAARPFAKGKIICVFGCGGDRDRTKRPQMGAIAARLSDRAVVTSDNPRTEDPQRILADILAGIPAETNPIVEADRRVAIGEAIAQSQPGDTVLIAGKGHEDYQILGTEKVHFDDREEAEAALRKRYGL
ncbi:UDP-N-acetylmuramoyl-L-alanyl-D-glutamate--2,6-diaminopimelate ligase [Altericista sp. CCNU0014]|uniref:UDP-N-acetylmuramoyl-L-alanyl-D-glutamate--2, 6-diaminopimelate ligase n=1 Tax=Altericista sp. CCNU0014 TaxID=3082949 RepID=UPI00384C2AAB